MAVFRICLSGSSQPLVVDLAANSVEELAQQAATSRFLTGHMAEPDEHGCLPGVMIQSARIQAAFEVS